MPFDLFIALRYFIRKKNNKIVNRISIISIVSIAIGSMALVIVLSVFNGFSNIIGSLYEKFDPDLKIELVVGKTFSQNDSAYHIARLHPDVELVSRVYEDNVLIQYDEITHPAIIKGVEKNWEKITNVKLSLKQGDWYALPDTNNFCVVGREIAIIIGLNLNFIYPMHFYAPKYSEEKSVALDKAFTSKYLFATGIFSILSELDGRYVIVPYAFTNELFEADSSYTSLEIKVKSKESVSKVQKDLQKQLGSGYVVKNRMEQHEFFHKVSKAEKWIVYAILTLIMIIASFSIVGSLMMLILDKKDDARTLRMLGAEMKHIKRLFLYEGFAITLSGTLIGLSLGYIVCKLQQEFKLLTIEAQSALIIDAYPVKIIGSDFLLIFFTIMFIGFVLSYYPVHFISNRYFSSFRKD